MSIIKVDSLKKRYGKKTALNDISFEIEKGEIIALLGPNGAGKTTLLRILALFIPPSEGHVTINGVDPFYNGDKALLGIKEKIGYFIEKVPLYNDMTVLSFLKFVSEIKIPHKNKRSRCIEQVIDKCRLNKVEKTRIKNLSRGYRQRVGFAQALINEPDILILDEPTVGLDPAQINWIRNMIKNMVGIKTIIFSSHILSEVNHLTDRVIIINEGNIVEDNSIEKLKSISYPFNKIELQVEKTDPEIIGILKNLPGVTKVELGGNQLENYYDIMIEAKVDCDAIKNISSLALANKWVVRRLTISTANLEEIFMSIISKDCK